MSAEEINAETLLERIRADGVRRACVALRKPPVPSRILQELVSAPDAPAEALEFVAAYPLSPSHLLESLAETASTASSVLAHLATNPRTPPHLLTRFAAHEDPIVRAQAATHPQLPGRELLALADDPAPEVRRALAASPALRLPHQAALITDTDPAVRLRLAAHPALPEAVALALAADPCAVVRLHSVATATADDELLELWATGDEEDIQLALLRRKNLPVETAHALVRSIHPSVRRLAREGLDLDDVDLFFLASRGEPDERAWVAAQPVVPRPLQSLLARDTDVTVRAALAANPALDASIARFFTSLAEETVCEALAANPALPDDLVEELAATRSPAVLAALAYRDGIAANLAAFLIEHSPDFRRHWAMQGREGAELDPQVARRLFADPLPSLRALAVDSCPGWRRADLYDVGRDPAPIVRMAALRHPNAPEGLLHDLADDPDNDVATLARRLLDRPRATVHVADLDARPAEPSLTVRSAGIVVDAAVADEQPDADPADDNPHADNEDDDPFAARAPELLNKLKRIFWQ